MTEEHGTKPQRGMDTDERAGAAIRRLHNGRRSMFKHLCSVVVGFVLLLAVVVMSLGDEELSDA